MKTIKMTTEEEQRYNTLKEKYDLKECDIYNNIKTNQVEIYNLGDKIDDYIILQDGSDTKINAEYLGMEYAAKKEIEEREELQLYFMIEIINVQPSEKHFEDTLFDLRNIDLDDYRCKDSNMYNLYLQMIIEKLGGINEIIEHLPFTPSTVFEEWKELEELYGGKPLDEMTLDPIYTANYIADGDTLLVKKEIETELLEFYSKHGIVNFKGKNQEYGVQAHNRALLCEVCRLWYLDNAKK